LEKASNEIKKREEVVEELTEEVRVGLEERENLKTELKTAEDAILGLKSSEIKWKVSNESKISEISGQNESVVERYKANVADLEKRVVQDEKALKEKEEAVKRLEGKLSELTYEKERSEARVQELTEKVGVAADEKKDLEKRIKALEKEGKETSLQLQATKESLTNEKVKFEEIQGKLNDTYSALSEAQVLNEKLRS
jgi:chromosome segregation ATPase